MGSRQNDFMSCQCRCHIHLVRSQPLVRCYNKSSNKMIHWRPRTSVSKIGSPHKILVSRICKICNDLRLNDDISIYEVSYMVIPISPQSFTYISFVFLCVSLYSTPFSTEHRSLAKIEMETWTSVAPFSKAIGSYKLGLVPLESCRSLFFRYQNMYFQKPIIYR